MNKTCKECGIEYTVGNSFHQLCHICNKKRLSNLKPFKAKSIDINTNTPKIKKISLNLKKRAKYSKPKPQKKRVKSIQKKIGVKSMFLEIWNERPHTCVKCGKALGEEPLTHFFSHIYPKSISPELRLAKSNIELLCYDCHQKHDFGDRGGDLRWLLVCGNCNTEIPLRSVDASKIDELICDCGGKFNLI